MKKFSLLLITGSLALFLFGCSGDTPTGPTGPAAGPVDKYLEFEGPTGTYEVIVENLTPATGAGASQPFSPPILATHRGGVHLFRPGSYASDELAQVAEDAVSGPLVDMLTSSRQVRAVVEGGGVILPGGDMRLEIEAGPGSGRLSLVFMLVNTNDAFGGLDGVKLPRDGEATYWVRAWDAGSEENTELMSDIPGPCCGSPGMGTDEHEVVMGHHGIMGTGDLDPAVYGWEGPVARVIVRKLD